MTKKATAKKSLYSVHPAIAYTQSIIDNLSKNTGQSMDQWISLVNSSGVKGGKAITEWLKKEHKLGGTTAWIITERTEGRRDPDNDPESYLEAAVGYVEGMYAGKKSGLRPIHDAIIELGMSLGADVRVCPCRTIVPLYRNHVFAQIKPSTQTRIDFGLALKGVGRKIPARIIDTGGEAKKDRITHRIEITSVSQVDDFVLKWAEIAYELDAK